MSSKKILGVILMAPLALPVVLFMGFILYMTWEFWLGVAGTLLLIWLFDTGRDMWEAGHE